MAALVARARTPLGLGLWLGRRGVARAAAAAGEVVNYATVEGAAWLEDARDAGVPRAARARRGPRPALRLSAEPVAETDVAGDAAAAAASPSRAYDDYGTPLMRQYLQIKAAYPEHILLFRLGDFYEMFFDDAVRSVPSHRQTRRETERERHTCTYIHTYIHTCGGVPGGGRPRALSHSHQAGRRRRWTLS
jgi:hypothetical protein